MELVKLKFTRRIPRVFTAGEDVVDASVALGHGVVHVRVERVVERWRRGELDAVLW